MRLRWHVFDSAQRWSKIFRFEMRNNLELVAIQTIDSLKWIYKDDVSIHTAKRVNSTMLYHVDRTTSTTTGTFSTGLSPLHWTPFGSEGFRYVFAGLYNMAVHVTLCDQANWTWPIPCLDLLRFKIGEKYEKEDEAPRYHLSLHYPSQFLDGRKKNMNKKRQSTLDKKINREFFYPREGQTRFRSFHRSLQFRESVTLTLLQSWLEPGTFRTAIWMCEFLFR